MLNKFLSNLPYNPSLLNDFSFYKSRLQKENSIRAVGIIMLILSLIVQVFAAAIPAEKSLAYSGNNVIPSAPVTTLGDLESKYKAHADVKALYNRFGINADDMKASRAKNTSFNFQEQGSKGTRTVGRINFASTRDNNLGSFEGTTFYSRSASEWSGSTPAYFFGKHKGTDNNWWYVWVLKDCGNIAYRTAPPPSKDEPVDVPDEPVEQPSQPIVNPELSCTGLYADQTIGTRRLTTRLTASYSANQANLVNGITFDFGDGEVYRHNGVIIDHTYANDSRETKVFTAKVTINSPLGDTTSPICQTNVTVMPENCPNNPALAPDDPACKVCEYNSSIPSIDEKCRPVCPYDPSILDNDERCKDVCKLDSTLSPDDPKCNCLTENQTNDDSLSCLDLVVSKSAVNVTQNLSYEKTVETKAKANDVIEYTLTIRNNGILDKTDYTTEDYIGDLLDYSVLDEDFLATQNGKYLSDSKKVIWENQTIPANGKITNTFRVKLKPKLPVTNQPNTTSPDFDCKMQNGYGNEVVIPVNCGLVKKVEQLPNTGPGTTIGLSFAITSMGGYFFARSKMLSKELKIIRKIYTSSGGK